jgi:hypothetical protein
MIRQPVRGFTVAIYEGTAQVNLLRPLIAQHDSSIRRDDFPGVCQPTTNR